MRLARRGILKRAGALPLLAGAPTTHLYRSPFPRSSDVVHLGAARPVVEMFNTERIVVRAWPAAENRIAVAELTY